jgi:phosphoglycerate dehydrogenase-like enzyme
VLNQERVSLRQRERGQPVERTGSSREMYRSMARPKVSVVGAGMVGGAVAQYLALRDYAISSSSISLRVCRRARRSTGGDRPGARV